MRAPLISIGLMCCAALSSCTSATSHPPSAAQKPSVSVSASELRASLKTLVARVGAPGAVLGVRVHDQAPIVVAVGSDPSTHAPFRVGDAFRVASLTKTFVAAAALRLVDKEQLRLDDPVARYLPNWPHGTQITIRELLTHTSGLPPFGGDTGAHDRYADSANRLILANVQRRFTPADILAFVKNRPLLFKPGTRTSYSNVNTILLGAIVARVTGRTIGEVLHQEIIDPLHLSATRYAAEEAAQYHDGLTTIDNGAVVDTKALRWRADITSQGAAGALVSNVPDLLTWGEALLRDRTIVSRPLSDTALHINPGGTGLGVLGFDKTQYFCALAQSGCDNRAVFDAIGGTGVTAGTRTILLYDRRTDTVLALIVARDGTPGVDELADSTLASIAADENRSPATRP
jgi:D-alanyl-D-alanine carboxypeptidase